MPKSKDVGSGANAVGLRKRRQQPTKTSSESKDAVVADLRKTIQRRYLRDSDVVKFDEKAEVKHKKTSSNKKHTQAKDQPVIGRGKKRDRNGKILSENPTDSSKLNGTKQADEEAEENILEREMKILGGTEEDLDLLAKAESDSEVEGDISKTDFGNLDKGMKNILKEIALAQGDLEDDDDSSNENDEKDTQEDSVTFQNGTGPKSTHDQKSGNAQRGRKQQLRCEPKPDWFNIPDLDIDMESSPKYTISKDSLSQLHEHAKGLLEEENQKFKESQQSSSAQSFYNTVITSGTLSDKISALTLAVQESPIHNIKAFETLMGLAAKRSRSQAVDVLRALKDLFAQGFLLPESRKLYTFQTQPSLEYVFGNTKQWRHGQKLPPKLEERHLIVWAFESWLKEQYFEMLKILEVWCNDEIEFSKARALSYVYELLRERPEQESNLLRLLVNKLGDPVKKIASQASYLLMQLLTAHPAMKMVVVSAIETDFIFRPGQSLHGKYYAVVTLNQTALSGKEEDVAVKLLDIYFGLFTGLLKIDERSVPAKDESKDEDQSIRKQRGKNPKSPKAPGEAQAEELREKLISAILTGVNRAYPYTTSTDASNAAFSDHLDTLFKITHSANFNTSVQSLMLIQQISHNSQHKASSDRFYRVLYESLLDPRLIVASKHQLYLNLLHRALKADLHVNRVKAFVKRLVQILSLHEPSFICGTFFLIQDLAKTFPSIKALVDDAEDHEDDDVEVFKDVLDEDEVVVDAPSTNAPTTEQSQSSQNTTYDAHKRDPLHANASNACLWELLPFLAHFHPSVSVSAEDILLHRPLSGKPDLNLHTLSHFLDRFVYRNPKLSHSGLRGSSLMQPMATDNADAVLIAATTPTAQRSLPVNSDAFRAQTTSAVAAEDVFFHQYFNALKKPVVGGKDKKDKKKAADRKKLARDVDQDGDEADDDEDEIWKAMMASAPDLEGDEFEDDDEDDLDLADLESDDDEVSDDGDDDEDDNFDDTDHDSGDEGVDIDPAFFDDDEDDLMDTDLPASAAAADDFAGFDSGPEAEAEATKPAKKAKKDNNNNNIKNNRKKLKNLPTFASVDDYAKMLEDDEDEDR